MQGLHVEIFLPVFKALTGPHASICMPHLEQQKGTERLLEMLANTKSRRRSLRTYPRSKLSQPSESQLPACRIEVPAELGLLLHGDVAKANLYGTLSSASVGPRVCCIGKPA